MRLEASDVQLAERLRSGPPGDEQAYNAIYKALYPRLVSIARIYVELPIAEELAQDVLGMLWERRAGWNVNDGIGVYLYAATRNRALKYIRHEGVIDRLEKSQSNSDNQPIHTAMGQPAESPQTAIERQEIRVAVDQVLAGLSEGARTAFLLRWMHELAYPEIAKIMNTSEETVRQQVARARRVVVPVLQKFIEK